MSALRPSRRFFRRPTLEVARALLGMHLVTNRRGLRTAGRIVEVEAYHGPTDAASHCHYSRTARNEVMFSDGGSCYVYFIYGNHFCVNVVTESPEIGAAVLIRAIEPTEGIATMRRRRPVARVEDLTNGPGKLCQALGITGRLSGEDLLVSPHIWIERGKALPALTIGASLRIGISRAKELEWRFYEKGSRFLSR